MSFGLTYKHRCVVHSHRAKATQNILIADATYLIHIRKILNDSTSKSANNSKFWNYPYNISKHYKYCRHCRIYVVKEEQSKEFMEWSENLCVRVKNKSSLNFMTKTCEKHDVFQYNQRFGTTWKSKCLQYPKKHHSHYLDSNLGSVKSKLTNKFLD